MFLYCYLIIRYLLFIRLRSWWNWLLGNFLISLLKSLVNSMLVFWLLYNLFRLFDIIYNYMLKKIYINGDIEWS